MKEFLSNITSNALPLLAITAIVLVMTLTLFNVIYKRNLQKNQQKTLPIIKHFLIDVVKNQEQKELIRLNIKQLKKKIPIKANWCKEMLIDEMIFIKKNLSPEEAQTITLIYRTLKLYKYSTRLINTNKIYKKCLGFYHYQTMHYSKGIKKIMPYLKSKNQQLKYNASVAYLSLTNISTGNTLYQRKKTIIRNKEKIENLFYIQKYPYNSNIDFWLKAKKTSILLLGLKIAAHESNGNDTDAIIHLLSFKNNSVKNESLITIRKLHLQEAETEILSVLHQFSPQLQEQSLQTLKVIGTTKTIEYIQKRMSFFDNIELKNSAIDCLETLVTKEQNEASQFYYQAVAH
ncbi:hypothetical protein [Flavobacterium succinicans]|uniref:HEAT repeat-containing protein n=1 Tax=Flavobacterium succinicans TaxID=29536 RepID=A0A199XRL6_9FLAO|nr:hypothetical protein [Flavobacterium succinicans]OAZ04275.1 hypothetical protein FLB_12690 [Flavobacterium succinicans]